jgi:hypothetical protein
MKFERSLPCLEEVKLREVEQLIGSPLPADYRAFLLTHNGGKPSLTGFRMEREGRGYSESSVAWLYGIQDGGEFFNSFELHYRGLRGRMPAHIIPIGSDPGGNQICISVAGPDLGRVYFWDHEKEADPDEDEEPGYDNLYFVANSFSDFLNGLFD